jgi:NSS family neurotransmitter:Na+ symporter
VGICFAIAIYYAAVLAWALRYTFFSLDQAWGDDPEGFFFGEFLQAGDVAITADVVPGVLVPLLWSGSRSCSSWRSASSAGSA